MDSSGNLIFKKRTHVILLLTIVVLITMLQSEGIKGIQSVFQSNQETDVLPDIDGLPELDFISNWNDSLGQIRKVEIKGKYAVLERHLGFSDDNLTILNIDNLAEPYLIKDIALGFGINLLIIINDYVYIFEDYGDNVEIYELTNPSCIERVGNFTITDGGSGYSDFFIQDNMLILLTTYHGLYIFNITNPISPTILDHNDFGYGYQLEIRDNLMYVYQVDNINIYSITDIYNPVKIANISGKAGEWYPREFKIYNDILYLDAFFNWNFTHTYRLWTYDISDPYNPVFIEEIVCSETIYFHIELDGPYLYTSFDNYQTVVYNLTDSKFEPCAKCLPSSFWDMQIKNGYIYFAVGFGGLTIVKALDYSTPTSEFNLRIEIIFLITISAIVITRRSVKIISKRKYSKCN